MVSNYQAARVAVKFASDFIRDLRLDTEAEQKCEWSCLLWSKDHWAFEASRSIVALQQIKDETNMTSPNIRSVESLPQDAQFLNTVAQIYAKLFDEENRVCNVKKFANCPFMNQRQDLLERGELAGVFVTMLHKATFYAMLDRHPLDSGMLHEEYSDVYGINLTDYADLEKALIDGRFKRLYETVVERASQLAGLRKTSDQKWPRVLDMTNRTKT